MRIAVCDDNKIFAKVLCDMLTEELAAEKTDAEIKCFTDGDEVIYQHGIKPFEAVFLDIDMPALSGFDVAKKIKEAGKECQVIFVTAHSELVYDSFLFRPLNFITKGNDSNMREKLKVVLDQLSELQKQNTTIILQDDTHGRVAVLLKDVIYISSNNHYVLYHIDKYPQPVVVRGNLKDLEQEYSENNFARIHKKYLVNLAHVFNINITNETVIFKEKFELPMSRSYKDSVNDKLTDYLRRTR